MKGALKAVNEPSNGGRETIDMSQPYAVSVTIEGSADLLFHRWNCEAVAEKAAAAKNSKGKKTDNIESYLWRDDEGMICLPGEYLRMSIINAAKYKQDPRSPRKSAMDLFKAGVVVLTDKASLGKAEPDYLDTRRVTIQRQGINRVRPAMKKGWSAEIDFQILLPEYIDTALFQDVISTAGRLVGVGDFRPTFGRFNVVKFELLPG